MPAHKSVWTICSEVTCLDKSQPHISKLLQGKSFRRGAQPPFLCGNSLYSCYFLSNNGTIPHVRLSLIAAPTVSPLPFQTVFVHVLWLETLPAELLSFMLIMTITYHPTVTKLLTYKWLKTVSQCALCSTVIKPSVSDRWQELCKAKSYTKWISYYFSIKTSFLRPILNCSTCFCLQFSMQQLIYMHMMGLQMYHYKGAALWYLKQLLLRCIWLHLGQVTVQQALIDHEEGVHILNPGYDLLQGHEVRADWWTSVGSTSLAVRFVQATPHTPC